MCAHTFAQRTPGETFLQGSHQSVLWLSLGKFPPLQSAAPHHHHHFHHISICISFWFTSENDPLQPINFVHSPPIASHRGIIGANWGAGSLPRRYQIRLLQLDFRRVLNLSVSYNKPGRADRKCPREIESEKTNVTGEK